MSKPANRRSKREAAETRWARRIADALCSGPAVGLVLALVFFVMGALSLRKLSYMGHTSDDLKQLAIQTYGAAVMVEHLKIMALYLGIGLLGGLLSAALCSLRDHLRGRRPASRLWRLARHLVVIGGLHLFFLARSIIIYPQLYAESLYDKGGIRRGIQVLLTDWFSPGLLDALLLTMLGAFVLLPFIGLMRSRGRGIRWWPGLTFRRALAWASAAVVLATFTVGAVIATAPRRARDNRGPNIIIIAVDSLRADRLDSARYRRVAPNMSRLARRGVHFTNAHVTLARTFPSWITLLTGQEPHSHGIRHMFPSWETRRRIGPNLPRHLRGSGWHTAVLSDYAGEIFGRIDLGFDHVKVSSFSFYEIIRQRVLRSHFHLLPYLSTDLGRGLAPPLQGVPDNADPRLLARRVNQTLDHVAQHRRFFMVVFFSTPHFPYAAPWPYYNRFTKPSYRGRFRYHKQRRLSEQKPSADDVRHIRQLYNGAVAAADDAIGQILKHLKSLGVDDRTIVVLTADHGENLYEGNLGMGHGDHLWGDLANRMPLVIYDPIHQPRARKVDAIVRDVDLAPTLAALVGKPLPGTAGRDLSPLIGGGAAGKNRAAFFETGLWFTRAPPRVGLDMRLPYPPVLAGLLHLDQKRGGDLVVSPRFEPRVVAAKHRAIRTRRWKLIYVPLASGVRYLLYDLKQDPDCRLNVASGHPQVVKRLSRRLTLWMRGDRQAIQVDRYVLPGPGGLTP